MHSYQKEVHHIRKTKNIFWLIVFVFAWLLYFYFQGYYPSINFSLRNILSSSGQARTDLIENVASIKSFGIINVSTLPSSATITLNNKEYSSNEKRMSDYGDYIMNINHLGYIEANLDFSIAGEKPYFIEAIHLVPVGRYSIMSFTGDSWKSIDTDTFIARSRSGTSLYHTPFASGILLTGFLGSRSIGDRYFISGSSIMRLDAETSTFIKINHTLTSHILDCPDPLIENESVFCKSKNAITLESKKTITGVIDHGNDWIKTSSGIIFSRNRNTIKTINTKGKDVSHIFSYKNNWYGVESGSLLKIEPERKIIVKTPLASIRYAGVVDGSIALIGESHSGNTLVFFTPNSELSPQLIPFPDISVDDIHLSSYEGNIYISTKKLFLLLYRGSHKIEWLVDGTILAKSDTAVLYEQGGKIWRAYFGIEE